MAEMTASEYLMEKARMTKECRIACADCLLFGYHNGTGSGCNSFEYKHTEQAITIVQKWAREHPRKTILQDFLEKYPNAPLEIDGTPTFCPKELGYLPQGYYNHCKYDCVSCWNQPKKME